MKKSTAYLLAAATGLLLTLSFPPFKFPFLAFVAFLPLLIFMEKDFKGKFWTIYLTFFVYSVGANWWIGSWRQDADFFLMLSAVAIAIVHPFFFAVPIVIYGFLRRKFGESAYWLFPFIWAAFEWAHSLGELSFPWLSVGYSQLANPAWAQFADIGGVWGLSFVIVLVNVIIFNLMLFYKRNKFKKFGVFIKTKFALIRIAAIALLIALPYFYGIRAHNKYDTEELYDSKEKIGVAVVQPHINPWSKWSSNVIEQIVKHKRLTDSVCAAYAKGDVDLVFWSETAIPAMSRYADNDVIASFVGRNWIDTSQIALITGFSESNFESDSSKASVTTVWDATKQAFLERYNAAMVLNPAPADDTIRVHRKQKLTPFSERIPYADATKFLFSWVEWGVGISSWELGDYQTPLIVEIRGDTIPVGTIICYESIYPDFCADYVRDGAELLAVITNDSWWNYTVGPEQHWQIARMRAIENRRFVARCANGGVSGFISPLGEEIARAPQYRAVALAEEVPLMKEEKSSYVRHGDWLPIGAAIISLAAFVIGLFFKGNPSEGLN